jgi:hypothetical protein
MASPDVRILGTRIPKSPPPSELPLFPNTRQEAM